jgi:hypothetical protein
MRPRVCTERHTLFMNKDPLSRTLQLRDSSGRLHEVPATYRSSGKADGFGQMVFCNLYESPGPGGPSQGLVIEFSSPRAERLPTAEETPTGARLHLSGGCETGAAIRALLEALARGGWLSERVERALVLDAAESLLREADLDAAATSRELTHLLSAGLKTDRSSD